MRNFYIIEGPDGTGKSSIARALAEHFGDTGALLVDPGSTPLGLRLREIVLDPGAEISALSRFFMFNAARASLIESAAAVSAEGRTVVFDRLWPSTLAYQCYGEGIDEDLVWGCIQAAMAPLNAHDVNLHYIFLNASHRVCQSRVSDRGKRDHFEQKDEGFYARVRAGYEEACSLFGKPAPAALSSVRTICTEGREASEVCNDILEGSI